MNNKTTTALYSIIGTIFTIAIVSLGVSYAFFSAKVTGSETTSTIVADAGTLNITVGGGNAITAKNILPDSTNAWGSKTITITGTNTTDKQMKYQMKLAVDYNTFTTTKMKYTLKSNNNDSNGGIITAVSTATEITAAAGGTQIIGGTTKYGYFVNASDKKHTYVLEIFFPETNTDQSADMGKKFGAHVVVEGLQVTS